MHDVGVAIGEQKNSNLRETKFSRGFQRRSQANIQQGSERKVQEIKEQRVSVQKAHRQKNLRETFEIGSNPITGQVDEKKILKYLPMRKNYPEMKYAHDAQRHHDDGRNLAREHRIASEGLTTTKKAYSVKEFFSSYDSYK